MQKAESTNDNAELVCLNRRKGILVVSQSGKEYYSTGMILQKDKIYVRPANDLRRKELVGVYTDSIRAAEVYRELLACKEAVFYMPKE